MLMPLFSQFLGKRGVREEESNLVGSPFDGVDQQTRMFVNDLSKNASHSRSKNGLSFPQGFRDGQAESFPKTLLHDYAGSSLQRADFQRTPWRQVQNISIRLAPCLAAECHQNPFAARLIPGASPR